MNGAAPRPASFRRVLALVVVGILPACGGEGGGGGGGGTGGGVPVGAQGNIEICVAIADQFSLDVAPDGAGGALLAWSDTRDNIEAAVYVQRIDESGKPLWTTDGLRVTATTNGQWSPRIVSDGSEGAIVVWTDDRNVASSGQDIYAQRISPEGDREWGSEGVAVCQEANNQLNPRLTSDGAAGAVLLWESRVFGFETDLFAQRLNGNGTVLWNPAGVALCQAITSQTNPELIPDGTGGAIVVWWDLRTSAGNIFGQRVDGAGQVLWSLNGNTVCGAAEEQSYPTLVGDGAGGAIVTWSDARTIGTTDRDVYAQRLDSSGAPLWASDGVPVSTTNGFEGAPRIVSDGAGGAIVGFFSTRDAADYYRHIYAQRLDPLGNSLWTVQGTLIANGPGFDSLFDVASDGAGGFFLVWMNFRNRRHYDLYAQHVSSAGLRLWDPSGVLVSAAGYDQSEPKVVLSGSGGLLSAWMDHRVGWPSSDIFAQHVKADGMPNPSVPSSPPGIPWHSLNTPVWTEPGTGGEPAVTPDGNGGVILVWNIIGPQTDDQDLLAQRLDALGQPLWAAEGVPIATGPEFQGAARVISDGSGGAIIIWVDSRNGNQDIFAQRIDASGDALWTPNGVGICTDPSEQNSIQLVPDGAGGAILVWQDWRDSATQGINLYAQRVDNLGDPQWTPGGIAIVTEADDQTEGQPTEDGAGGAIFVWEDRRSGTQWDIYGQRVNAAGVLQWPIAGAPVSTQPSSSEENPHLISDGSGGATVTWQDSRNGTYDIFAQRIDGSGASTWAADGVAVCTAIGSQGFSRLVAGLSGASYVIWTDFRGGFYSDVYAQRLDASGAPQWTADGLPICAEANDQVLSAAVPDGVGGLVVAWRDVRSTFPRPFVQHVDQSGVHLWAPTGLAVSSAAYGHYGAYPVKTMPDGYLIIWSDSRRDTASGIYSQALTPLGQPVP